jgi:tetratricopeptide (TPR) repeat protein
MVFQAEDRAKTKKSQAEAAIQMALQGRWDDAVQLNRAILESFPTDVDACNRLGKALTELGRYGEARDAYMKAIEIDPLNTIAQKNMNRLATLGEAAPPKPVNQKLSPQMFIEETGKTGITILNRANMDAAARLTAGDQVQIARSDGSLVVNTLAGDFIGEVEPRLGQRLAKLMEGGNQYVAAISGMDDAGVRVFIRETFQDAGQTGKLSFPPTVSEPFRPYVKERLLRQDADDEGYFEEGDEADDWAPAAHDDSDDDEDVSEGGLSIETSGSRRAPAIDIDDESDDD